MNGTVVHRVLIAGFVFLLLGLGTAGAETRLLRYPDIHGDLLVFCHGGDLYTAPVGGGTATRITDFPGEELLPRFSPDGRQIAFTAEFDGNKDVYVISVSGGEPFRLTYHAADDLVVDWHPGGDRVLFRSNRASHSFRFRRLFEVAATGGLPVALAIPEAELSSYDDTGDRIAFCRTSTETLTWKGYRGGALPRIWTYDVSGGETELVVQGPAINHHPVWLGEEIYFVSDRGEDGKGGEQNLWAYDTKRSDCRQITFFREWGVNWPSRGGDRIVYENGGRLFVYDATSGANEPVAIEIALPANRFVEEKNVAAHVGVPALSPDGTELVLCARGELFHARPGQSRMRNLTNTSGVNERAAVWSPDGSRFAYISDATGEEQIYLRSVDDDEPVRISRCESSRTGGLRWSPDGAKIGYADKRAKYYVVDIDSGQTTEIFFDEYMGSDRFATVAWSPDSRWLAYSLGNPNWSRSVFLYSMESGRSVRVTDEIIHCFEPQFDPEGNYLFWIADCQVNVRSSYGDGDHHMIDPSRIIVATLRKETPSIFAGEPAAATTGPIRIDLEGLGERIEALPTAATHASRLAARKGKLVYRSEPEDGESSYMVFDLASGTESELIAGSRYCAAAARADKAVYLTQGQVGVIDLGGDHEVGDGLVDLSGLNMRIDSRQEWRQIFTEAWRIQRDFFFDEKLHGVDWPAMKAKYETLLPYVAFRSDLNYLIEQMYSELRQSHAEIYGGDFPETPGKNNGVLGVDLAWQNGAYRIRKIHHGQNWDPDRSNPLCLPGVNIQEGDYLLAIDDVPLRRDVSPYARLEGLGGEVVSLTVNSRPTFDGAVTRDVTAASLTEREGSFLRYNEWVLANIETVSRASDGRIGYIHVPDTYLSGIEAFFRYFYTQRDKEALILDIRYNSGGYPPFWMIDRLNRKEFHASHHPYGKASLPEPDPGFFGPKVCLTNEWAESGGDLFAAYFRLMDSGLIIGETTAGNLASARGFRLIDGGVVVYPAEGFRNQQGEDMVENVGIEPDIRVANDPQQTMQGRDQQLERAVQELLMQLDGPEVSAANW